MHVIGHDHCGPDIDSLAVVMYTMRENEIACLVGEGITNEFAEGHKDSAARLLVMRHAPSIFVFAAESGRVGHDSIEGSKHGLVSDGWTSKMLIFFV